ncbi:hypothetical protein FQN60_008598 [Etheostoma spectabile]|uniref:Uncharacterized protein n=1 Tax=Etheostoma spectabile TaxID=54343 RepID=A0A5J5CIW0_9PERO|nr:hypothetical protein FQN60_008598 [Etheostoma spectabile]
MEDTVTLVLMKLTSVEVQS